MMVFLTFWQTGTRKQLFLKCLVFVVPTKPVPDDVSLLLCRHRVRAPSSERECGESVQLLRT